MFSFDIMKNHFIKANSEWDAGNFYRAFRLFLAGAKAGDVSCQASLGYFYDNGIGVSKDPTKAFHWYLRACEEGQDPVAAHNLAILYREVGDLQNAKKYFMLAVELGDPDSLIELAELAVKSGDLLNAEKLLKQLLAQDKSTVIPSVRQQAHRKLKKIFEENAKVKNGPSSD